MRKYETDGRYPSQYGFYSGAKSRHTLSRPVSPLIPSTHDGLTYDRTNSSALQATTSRGAHGRVVVNDAQSVINDTTDLSKGLPVINDTTDLSEGLPVINDTSTMTT